jgi:TLD
MQWHRIYSSFFDGRSFNRLEWSLMGYNGPTLLVVKTTAQHVLGALASAQWKQSKAFYGNADCFLFDLTPRLGVYRAAGGEGNFMYLHSEHEDHGSATCSGLPHGLGLGGSLDKPRLFIPESFQRCSAGVLDKTFQSGELLPVKTLEKFEIQHLEVWGVGGDETITSALRDRAEYRERCDAAIHRARTVHDKMQFTEDMQSGLIPTTLYEHHKDVRGRQEFSVDDTHGGYKIEP